MFCKFSLVHSSQLTVSKGGWGLDAHRYTCSAATALLTWVLPGQRGAWEPGISVYLVCNCATGAVDL